MNTHIHVSVSEQKGTPVPETRDTQVQSKGTYANIAAAVVPQPNNTPKPGICQDVKFKCCICGHGSINSDELKLHIMSEHTEQLQNSKPKTQNNKHVNSEHKMREARFTCHRCEIYFRKEYDLNSHIASKHTVPTSKPESRKRADDPLRYNCQNCGRKFQTSHELNKHIDKVHVIDSRKFCRSCDIRFRNNSEFSSHVRDEHKAPAAHCQTCNSWFGTLDGYRNHTLEHTQTDTGRHWQKQDSVSKKHGHSRGEKLPDPYMIPTHNRYDPLSKKEGKGRTEYYGALPYFKIPIFKLTDIAHLLYSIIVIIICLTSR